MTDEESNSACVIDPSDSKPIINYTEKNKINLSCNHVFHHQCIKTMIIKRSRKCPLCRTKITWNIEKLNSIQSATRKQISKCIRKSKRICKRLCKHIKKTST